MAGGTVRRKTDHGGTCLGRHRGHSTQAAESWDEAAECQALENRVAACVRDLLPGDVSLQTIAAALGDNAHTLQRKLATRGLTFRRLLDDCRRREALAALREPGISVAVLSRRLGYSHPAHLTRAFRRWTGETPSSYAARLAASKNPHLG
jgi:AraC-like DNA-binding protein